MYKPPKIVNLFFIAVLLQGCSWTSRNTGLLDESLLAAMQQPAIESAAEQQQVLPVKVDYEIRHKPLPGQKLLIALEIKPAIDLPACAYSVKAPEAVEIVEPLGVIDLGSLKAGETYHEEIRVKPVSEGLYELKIFLAAEVKDKEQQIKTTSIPISIGPFQKTRDASGR